MIAFNELIKGTSLADIPIAHQQNLQDLLNKVNQVRTAWAKPMTVTSGYRSMQDHLRIYSQKGITDKSKIPMQSNHLYGKACDISDPKRELQAWCKANESLLASIGLWMEDFSATPTWVHFQIVPPKSGKRFFMP